MLLQVRKFLKGLAHDSRSTNHELIKSSVMLLKTLPATRFAVLEYFSSVYDDAVYNLLSSNEDSMDGELCDLINEIQQSLLAFVQINPHAWTPIISSWSIEKLGELSSKYTRKHLDKKHLSMSASLNEVLQMWMGCRASQSLIEISSECIAAMVGDTPDSCVDALLEASVKHSPHFDWVVAHIGSCFPTTIINRVLMCGLKDFCLHGNSQAEIGIVSQDKMPKFASVVGILGHLASQHGREIQMALLALFEESLIEDSSDLYQQVVPFLLRLASLSPMLLKVITTDFISILNTDILNKLAVQSQHWYEKGEADNDSLLHLLVHLMTISESGTYRMLQILLTMAFPDVSATKTEDMDTDQKVTVRSEVQSTCRKVLDLLIADLTKVAHTKGVEGSEDIPFLKGLQHHASSISRLYSESQDQRQKCLSEVLKCLTLSSGSSQASRLMCDMLISSQSHSQLSFFISLQEELQIKYADILENLLRDFFHLVQAHGSAQVKVTALGNLVSILKWEETSKDSKKMARHRLMSKLTGHLDNLTALLSSPDLDVSLAAMDILNAISLPTILSMPCVFKLCHAAAAHLFRIFRAVDLNASKQFRICDSCKDLLLKLCSYPTAQKTLLRLLLESALTKHEDRMSLGGKCIQRSESIVQHLESHSAGLLQANRTKSVSQGALIQKQTGDNRVKRGLVPKDQVYHNKHQFLDILWRIACYSSGNQGASKQGASVTTEKDKHQSDELIPSPHISRVFALGLIELVTPDVIYNAIPWPEEEFLKVTIERDLLIKRRFEENPILWDIFHHLSSAPGAMCYCSSILRALMATQLYHWDSCRDKAATNSPMQYEITLKLICYMRKGELLPPPLSYSGEIIQYLSPYEVFLVLCNLWKYMKENPPVPEERNWKEKGMLSNMFSSR